MTGEMYDEMITSRLPGKPLNDVPWVILFVRHVPNDDDVQSKNALDKLAVAMDGQIRFAWVDKD